MALAKPCPEFPMPCWGGGGGGGVCACMRACVLSVCVS